MTQFMSNYISDALSPSPSFGNDVLPSTFSVCDMHKKYIE